MTRTDIVAKYAGQTVLAVGAHPDDLEIGAGGLLARLKLVGARVVMVVLCVPDHLEARIDHARRSAEILGGELRVMFPDDCRRVEDIKTYDLVSRLDELVRQLQPALMLAHAATNFHKDHVLAHSACLATARISFHDMLCFYPTSCHPVQVSFFPQVYVDISKTIDEKMQAIDAHTTQFTCKGLSTDHYRDTARHYGRLAGVEYAEGLEVGRLIMS